MAADFKAYIKRLQIAPKVEDFEPELDDKNEAKDLELRWGSRRMHRSGSHSACAKVLYAGTSNGAQASWRLVQQVAFWLPAESSRTLAEALSCVAA